MTEAIGRQAIAKVSRRLLPFMALLYFVNFLDRINLGFAALTMNKDLGLSAYVYGLGAGIFFFGYFIFEVPSNLILERIGARLWIARIMLTWGLISAGMAFVTGETSFIVMRFLLGVAEAGFFPGMILYLTYWYPAPYRARVIAGFMLAIPVSIAIGAPLSTTILGLDGLLGRAVLRPAPHARPRQQAHLHQHLEPVAHADHRAAPLDRPAQRGGLIVADQDGRYAGRLRFWFDPRGFLGGLDAFASGINFRIRRTGQGHGSFYPGYNIPYEADRVPGVPERIRSGCSHATGCFRQGRLGGYRGRPAAGRRAHH